MTDYKKFMKKAEFEKALSSLKGILYGIKADGVVNDSEIEELQHWCLLQTDFKDKEPFHEIIALVQECILDSQLSPEEVEDIMWCCDNYLNHSPYFNAVTSDIQTLHGLVHGILSDNIITADELRYLREWLNDNSHLESVYPYDEMCSLLHIVLRDGVLDHQEEKMLKAFFGDFIDARTSANINHDELNLLKSEMNVQGICALGPNIEFSNKVFCFTGASSRIKRTEFAEIINQNGGVFHDNVVRQTDYLVVGDDGNPCWAFSCYGRKIEKAIKLRKEGKPLLIVHEIDFWDALN